MVEKEKFNFHKKTSDFLEEKLWKKFFYRPGSTWNFLSDKRIGFLSIH